MPRRIPLSISNTIDLCRTVGFPESVIPTAVAIAICESDLDPKNHCLNCFPGILEDSRGLWQINVRAHPEYRNVDLFDPTTNARAALNVSSNGTDFNPWSTFKDGCYQRHLANVVAAMRQPVTVTVDGTVVNNAEAFLLDDLTYGWIRPIANSLNAQIVDFNSTSVSLVLAGEEQILPANIQNGQAFVHLGDFRKFATLTVNYDPMTQTVAITTNE